MVHRGGAVEGGEGVEERGPAVRDSVSLAMLRDDE